MADEIVLSVTPEAVGMRIDRLLNDELVDMTRSAIQKIIDDEGVTVNGNVVSKNYKARNHDEIVIKVPEPKTLDIVAENIPLDIRYEDDDLLVVNKPKGMVVHPAAGNYSGTLVNALMHHCGDSLSGINGVIRPGIVHRIDKDTSGLLIVAKNDLAHVHLAEQIKVHSFTREYQCIVYGGFKDDKGTVDAPIGRHHTDRKKMAVTDKNSKNAVTHYFVENRYNSFTHLRVRLETGRTHQIRVHMSYIGHPIAGDEVYGPKNRIKELGGQCLHAGLIGFIHPRTKRFIEIKSELPDYFTEFVKKIDNQTK